MTVSKIRELMQERVVPEIVLPQNIAASLMDENSAPPELDAFTFLNRLRSLGIGSADFLYLLQGCGAPAEAVERISSHPDMNLQSLIVTLDGSGLTPKDYTRMLYTARQLWERTITMRIDLEEQPEEAAPSPAEKQEFQEYAGVKPIGGRESSPESSEVEPEPLEKPSRVRTARQKKKTEQEFREYAGVKPIGERESSTESPQEEPEPEEKTSRVRTARQKKKTEQEFREYAGVKPIGSRRGSGEDEGSEEVFTAIQLKEKLSPEEEAEDIPEEEQPSEPIEDSPEGRKRGIIASAIGAAVVCAVNVGVALMGFSAPESLSSELRFAGDSSEIFSEIYSAYNAGRLGGDSVQPLIGNAQVFGDLLIDPGEQLGTFTAGGTVWAAEPDIITVYDVSGASPVASAEVVPPENAQFLRVFAGEDGITAVFSSDSECGLMGIGADGAKWTSAQSGKLTDLWCGGDTVSLGSVYTPAFRKSFTAGDVLEYLPWTSLNGAPAAFQPGEIAVDGSALGCSYALRVEYSADSGEQLGKMAALGDPVFSGAERFTAAMENGSGSEIISCGEDGRLTVTTVHEITACTAGGGYTVTAEQTDAGLTVYIRGSDLEPVSAFTAGDSIAAVAIQGNTLCISDGERIINAVDMSDPASPKALELTAADGVVNDGLALCWTKTASGITITQYKLDDGKAVQSDLFSKQLSAQELSTLSFIGANSAYTGSSVRSGAAYRWFDGVSLVEEFAEMGKSRSVKTFYDDSENIRAVAFSGDELIIIKGQ